MIKWVIYGLLRRYSEKNTYYSNSIVFADKLVNCIIYRGHQAADIKPIFLQAHHKVKSTTNVHTNVPSNIPMWLIQSLHLQKQREVSLRPSWIQPKGHRKSQNLPTLCKHCHTFENSLSILSPTITYSRPKNIGDFATQARLFEAPGKEASNFMGGIYKD